MCEVLTGSTMCCCFFAGGSSAAGDCTAARFPAARVLRGVSPLSSFVITTSSDVAEGSRAVSSTTSMSTTGSRETIRGFGARTGSLGTGASTGTGAGAGACTGASAGAGVGAGVGKVPTAEHMSGMKGALYDILGLTFRCFHSFHRRKPPQVHRVDKWDILSEVV